MYEKLLNDLAFSPEKLKDGTSNKTRLLERYMAAKRFLERSNCPVY